MVEALRESKQAHTLGRPFPTISSSSKNKIMLTFDVNLNCFSSWSMYTPCW